MRFLSSLFFIVCIIFGLWWLWTNDTLSYFTDRYFDSGEIRTLEARYTAEKIIDNNREELLRDDRHKLQKPMLMFFPYLLMEVKYIERNGDTGEGMILWGLEDGEMVLDVETWETTHGFEDCINAGATSTDFLIINAIAYAGGSMSRRDLQTQLHVEADTLDGWIEKVRKKHLIVSRKGRYYLHFKDPKLDISPRTTMGQWLVTTPYNHAKKIDKKYSRRQIYRIAKAAFGQDFAIRSDQEIFLPVYKIEVQNPDGTVLTTYWNALTGKRMTIGYLS